MGKKHLGKANLNGSDEWMICGIWEKLGIRHSGRPLVSLLRRSISISTTRVEDLLFAVNASPSQGELLWLILKSEPKERNELNIIKSLS